MHVENEADFQISPMDFLGAEKVGQARARL